MRAEPRERTEEEERAALEEEEREDARRFILDSLDAGVPTIQIFDELGSFFDGDPTDLF